MTQPNGGEEIRRWKDQLKKVLEKYSNLQLWWVSAHPSNHRHAFYADSLLYSPYRNTFINNLAEDLATRFDRLDRVAGSNHLTEPQLVKEAEQKGLDPGLIKKLQNSSVGHSNQPLPTSSELLDSVHLAQHMEWLNGLSDEAIETYENADELSAMKWLDRLTAGEAALEAGARLPKRSSAVPVYDLPDSLARAAAATVPGVVGVPQVVDPNSIPTTGPGPGRTATQGAGGPSAGGR